MRELTASLSELESVSKAMIKQLPVGGVVILQGDLAAERPP